MTTMLQHLNMSDLLTHENYGVDDNEPNDIEFMDVTQSNERGFYDWGFSITSITHPIFPFREQEYILFQRQV